MDYGTWEGIPKDTTAFVARVKQSPTGFYDFHKWTTEIDVARYELFKDEIAERLATDEQIQRIDKYATDLFKAVKEWWYQHHEDVPSILGLDPSLIKEEIIGSGYSVIKTDQFTHSLQIIRYTIVVRTYKDYLSDVKHPESLFQKFEMPILMQTVIESPEP